MKDDKDQTVLERFSYRQIHPRSRIYGGSGSGGVRASCAVQPSDHRPAPAGCCEFVRGLAFEGATGRLCTAADDTFCPPSYFADAKVFLICPTYLAKSKAKKEQP